MHGQRREEMIPGLINIECVVIWVLWVPYPCVTVIKNELCANIFVFSPIIYELENAYPKIYGGRSWSGLEKKFLIVSGNHPHHSISFHILLIHRFISPFCSCHVCVPMHGTAYTRPQVRLAIAWRMVIPMWPQQSDLLLWRTMGKNVQVWAGLEGREIGGSAVEDTSVRVYMDVHRNLSFVVTLHCIISRIGLQVKERNNEWIPSRIFVGYFLSLRFQMGDPHDIFNGSSCKVKLRKRS